MCQDDKNGEFGILEKYVLIVSACITAHRMPNAEVFIQNYLDVYFEKIVYILQEVDNVNSVNQSYINTFKDARKDYADCEKPESLLLIYLIQVVRVLLPCFKIL